LSRSKAHDEAFDKLKEIINDPSSSKSAVDKAAEQLADLTDTIKLEADVEALIKSKCGFNSVVLINSDTAQVVCEKGSLNSTSILKIKEIILKHTDIISENITIFETK
ncbi:MAG: SpoIIIAH-like family protein, partial [Clostridia bacterium]|nr:SpoIIIAH-like family protein [Clostridia bacterium]